MKNVMSMFLFCGGIIILLSSLLIFTHEKTYIVDCYDKYGNVIKGIECKHSTNSDAQFLFGAAFLWIGVGIFINSLPSGRS